MNRFILVFIVYINITNPTLLISQTKSELNLDTLNITCSTIPIASLDPVLSKRYLLILDSVISLSNRVNERAKLGKIYPIEFPAILNSYREGVISPTERKTLHDLIFFPLTSKDSLYLFLKAEYGVTGTNAFYIVDFQDLENKKMGITYVPIDIFNDSVWNQEKNSTINFRRTKGDLAYYNSVMSSWEETEDGLTIITPKPDPINLRGYPTRGKIDFISIVLKNGRNLVLRVEYIVLPN